MSIQKFRFEGFLSPSAPWEMCYPYPRMNTSDENVPAGVKSTVSYKSLVLENEHIRAVIVPALGGRLYELFDKISGQDVLYKTNMVKPATLYGRGAGYICVIGGFKYGFPSYAHSPTDMSAWEYKTDKAADGSISVTTYVTDLETDMKLSVTHIVRPDASYVEFRTKIENPTPYKRKYYYWMCCQMEQTNEVEFVFPSDRMVIHGDMYGWPMRGIIGWPVYEGVDYSLFKNWNDAQGLFQLKCKEDFFGAYDHGKKQGIVRIFPHETATGTKLWCFQKEGAPVKMYSENKNIYYELFGGVTASQDDYAYMEPKASVEWSEFWYPINNTGGFVKATKECALNLRVNKDKDIAATVYFTSKLSVPSIEYSLNGKGPAIFLDLSISASASVSFVIPGKDLKDKDIAEIKVKEGSKILLTHTANLGALKNE
ncbi:MAG: DUF5107 domain-containing protein [Candidatus Firestonebacteria bacterium]